MASEIIRELSIDLHDSKYIQINAKQFDRDSRYILFTCYNKNVIFPLNSTDHHVYIRYRKSDNLGVFNSCKITEEGKILVELSEQMLAMAGKCYGDLVVVYSDPTIEDDKIMSTMWFCINVIAPSFENQNIESSYEFNALNELLIKANRDYNYVIITCKISEENAKLSEENAKLSEQNALVSEQKAKASEEAAKVSEQNSFASEQNAKASEEAAKISEQNAKAYETTANIYSNTAIEKADEANNYATIAKSYAVGGTSTREHEDADNSKYYYSKVKGMSDTLGGLFIPKGTIEFSELQTVEKEAGYVYHIKEDFTTDETFKDGGGISYSAGTNVYCTSDGYWDCFAVSNLTVIDDDNGNVEFISCQIVEAEAIKTIEELQERIKVLEEQTVLGITE